MNNRLLLGFWRFLVPLPAVLWESHLPKIAKGTYQKLGFMSEDHHRVRNFVVTEIPKLGVALSPEYLSQQLDIPQERLTSILDELEKNMTFLFRNEQGEVTWAYPVTVDKTPHQVRLNTGESVYAA